MVDLSDLPGDPGRDPLTGLWNHASIATIEPDVAVAYVDIVHFRDRVNRPYGHVVGDRVLQGVARRLQDRLAPSRVFRFGGDEFLVEILEPLDRMKAAEWASRIERLVEEPIEGINEPLAAHIGIAFGSGRFTWGMAVMAGDRASSLDLPFLVDDGATRGLDPWEP